MLCRALIAATMLALASPWAATAHCEEPQSPPPAADKAAPADQADPNAEAKKARAEKDAEYYEMFKVLADTMDQVERNYVKDISRRELMEAAIRGVLEKLDPYSNYISPDEIGRFKTAVENQFGGIGIQVDVRHGRLMVVSPIVGSPAYRAGLQAGDVIVEIDGQSSADIDLDGAIRRLKGEAGSSVTITLVHPPKSDRRTVTIQREIIHLETVLGDRRDDHDRWDYMLDRDKRIGYIRITSFGRDTFRDLHAAMKELDKQKLRGLIVDLRFNPGGLLASAIEVADLFLTEGEIVSTSGRNSPKRSWSARKPDTFEGFPMVVLVNRYSASASEIVSASLQDHKRALVIGERTWGKGSVQNVIELESGKSALKLTTAAYRRPNGQNIHRFPDSKESDQWGVMPDAGYEIKLSDEEMGQLVAMRRERDILLVNHAAPQDASSQPAQPAAPDSEKAADAPQKPKEAADEKKPDEKKPDESKSDSSKSESPEGKSPEEKPTEEKPAEGAKPDDAGKQPADRQLQKALDYLSSELAKAQ